MGEDALGLQRSQQPTPREPPHFRKKRSAASRSRKVIDVWTRVTTLPRVRTNCRRPPPDKGVWAYLLTASWNVSIAERMSSNEGGLSSNIIGAIAR